MVNRRICIDGRIDGRSRGISHGSPSKESLKAGERRWLPQVLKQLLKPDAL
jgi:hypothetical protein